MERDNRGNHQQVTNGDWFHSATHPLISLRSFDVHFLVVRSPVVHQKLSLALRGLVRWTSRPSVTTFADGLEVRLALNFYADKPLVQGFVADLASLSHGIVA